MPSLFRNKQVTPIVTEDEVMWGVARREGLSDTDDPIPHEGLMQHAFLFGEDEVAICGYKPPKRLSRADKTPRAQLALSGPDNPECPKCTALIGPAVHEDDEIGSEVAGGDDQVTQTASPETADADSAPDEGDGDGTDQPAPRTPDWSPRPAQAEGSTEQDEAEADADDDDEGETDDEEQPDESASGRSRSRVRRGGRVTLAAGRRSVVTQLPPKARGLAIAAEIEGDAGDLRVQSVAVRDDGTARITLNHTTDREVELLWFIVSGRRHPGF